MLRKAIASQTVACEVPVVEAIVRYATAIPVFPCRRTAEIINVNGRDRLYKPKSPLTPRGFKDASQDESQIRGWWKRWPDALVGMPTGHETRLICIDYDVRAATEATNNWIAEHADALMSGLSYKTPSGGRHYLFNVPESSRFPSGTSVTLGGVERPGLDIRGEGGYIVYWPLHGYTTLGALTWLPSGLIDDLRAERHELPVLPSKTPEQWAADKPLVIAALAHLDPSNYKQGWIEPGLAIHLASGGSEDGFAVWDAYSAGEYSSEVPHNYAGTEECRHKWASFAHDKDRGETFTLGSLFKRATDAGWIMPKAAPVASMPFFQGIADPQPTDAATVTWPAPPPGLLGDLAGFILKIGAKPDPSAATVAALTIASALIGPRYRLSDGKPLAVFAMIIGSTGSGKEGPTSAASYVVPTVMGAEGEFIGPRLIAGRFASGEAMEDLLALRPSIFWVHDEAANSSGGKKGAQDTHRISLDAAVLRLWGGTPYTTRPRAGKDGKVVGGITIERPYMVCLEATTPDSIERYMTPSAIGGGRFGRMLFVALPDDKPFEWVRSKPVMPAELAQRLRTIAHLGYRHEGRDFKPPETQVVRYTSQAERAMVECGERFDAQRREAGNEVANALLSRSFEKVLRVTGVLAVLDAPTDPLVTPAHVAWAEQAVAASNAVVLGDIACRLSDDEREAYRLRVLDMVRRITSGKLQVRNRQQQELAREGYASHGAVLKASRLSSRDFLDVISTLMQTEELGVTKASVLGKPVANGSDPDLYYIPKVSE